MLTLVAYLVVLLAVPGHADNVEVTSNKERQFACPGDQVIFTCQILGSISLEWRSPLISQPVTYRTDDRPPEILDRGPFTATLMNVSGTSLNSNFTSTLQVNASKMFMRNKTTVMCLSSTMESETDNFTVADIPTAPLNVSVIRAERASEGGHVNNTITWIRPPNFDQFDIDRYDISVTSTSEVQSMTTACGQCTSTVITVSENPNNVRMNTTFTATITAVNQCEETGPSGTASYTLIDCRPPVAPRNGSLESYTETTEGSEVFYRCDPGLVPEGRMRAMCTRNEWSPNPADMRCVANCSDPTVPQNGSVEADQGTLEGAEIFFRCNPGFVPTGRMRAVCGADGRWNPDPATLTCTVTSTTQVPATTPPATTANCSDPTVPQNGSVEADQGTLEGAEIFFRCNPGFVPTGRMRAVCGADGRWNPDPATLTCTVTSTTQVPATTPPATTGSTPPSGTSSGLDGGAVAGIVIVVLLVVILAVAVVIVVIVWRRRQSDVPPKLPPQSDDVAMYSVVEDPEETPPYKGYMDQGPGTEAEYTTVSDVPGAQSKAAEAHYDLPPGSNHPEGLVYASVDIKPKKPSVHHPKPVKQDDRVEYAAIEFQPKDAAIKSQAAAATAPKTKRYENADEMVNLDNLLIQLRDVTPMWFELGDALDLPPSILDDIRGQFETNPEQCMIEMVDVWLQRHLSRGSPTWTEVAEALRKINQNGLADALESVYYTGELPISVNMTEIPESMFQDGSGTPPPIPIRGTLTDDVEPAPPKPPKSWGTPEKKAPPQHPPRGGSGRRPPPRPPKPSAP